MDEEKKEQTASESPKKFNFTEKIRENPWILSTFVSGVLILILLVTIFSGGITGNVVAKNKAADSLVGYAESQGIDLSVNGITEESGLYNLNCDVNGNPTTLYMTKDGKNLITNVIPLATKTTDSPSSSSEVQKSDKPSVELYVFTYCPYGLQMEKAMIPAVKLLGNSIDFKIRQIGAMHGEAEEEEAKRQLCIEKNYPNIFLDYVLAFAEDTSCPDGSSCINAKLNSLYSKFGIDANKVNSCMSSEGASLYNAEVSNANSKGIGGSPTLVINGVETQASRSEEGIKGAICSAFNNVPSICQTTLSTSQASPGFGTDESSSSSAAQC